MILVVKNCQFAQIPAKISYSAVDYTVIHDTARKSPWFSFLFKAKFVERALVRHNDVICHFFKVMKKVCCSNGNASETKANKSFDNGVFFDIEAKRTPSIISKLFSKRSEHIR